MKNEEQEEEFAYELHRPSRLLRSLNCRVADKSRIVQCCLLNERLLHKKLFHLQKSKFQFLNDKSFDFIIKYISIHL